ncbi:MAG: PqqD family protein [Anaerolineales bacterium]
MMNAEKRYVINPVVSCGDEGEDGAVLFNPDTDDMLIVNPTGRTIWEMISTPHTPVEVAAHLMETFRGPSLDQAANDVEQFIQDLLPDFIQEMEVNPDA